VRFGGQRAADLGPARLQCDRVEAQARAGAAAEADAAELVSVLVDEADADAVLGRNTASAPQLSCGSRVGGCGETGELWAKPDGYTVCDLVGERRDRILGLVEVFHRNQVLGRVRKSVAALIVSDKNLYLDQSGIYSM
jgi:hypothetical protein